MKWLQRICSILIALCLFLILLINAIDYSVYYRPDFYKTTYEKYNVTDAAQMDMEEVLRVSDYLIDYLKGKEESLKDFRAVVNGQERLFYSQRELLHMKDVRNLFLGGLLVRKICLGIGLLLLTALILTHRNFMKTLLYSIIGTFLTALGIAGILTLVIISDFNRAFVIFHQIFFSNDLWILDPETDWIIRLLPEGFFMDMAAVIATTAAISLSVILLLSTTALYLLHRRNSARSIPSV